MSDKILEINGLKTWFHVEKGIVKAVNDVSFTLDKGEILGVVGESGCGKSMTALSIMRLIQSPPGKIEGGEILYNGKDLLKMKEKELRRIRGNEISMIFQEPMTSLNPVFRIVNQINEVLRLHENMKKDAACVRAKQMLDLVGIPAPEKVLMSYPHELSGGMRQRVMIAMALSCSPSVLIADEPTTALDVTIQAQILKLINEMREKTGAGILFITHDLGVVAELCDKIVVMYCGKIIEKGLVKDVIKDPKHPYTEGLMESIPKIKEEQKRLYNIKGAVPSPFELPSGCKFAPRCTKCMPVCKQKEPSFIQIDGDRSVRCFLYEEAYK